MSRDLKYAVVIVTYNRLELLKECVQNAIGQTYKFNNIIIVDNNSSDGTREYLANVAQDNENIHVYTLDKNIGGAGGFSYGLEQVTSDDDYVLLIDDDAIINPDYIEQINNHVEDGILAYSGSVYRNNKIDTLHRRRIKSEVFMSDENVPLDEYNNESFIYDVSSFCGLVVNVDLVKKIGLPRKEFFIWYDDSEYSMRIKKYTVMKNVNAAIIDHKVLDTVSTGLSWKTYYGFRNYNEIGRVYSKHPSLFMLNRYKYHIEGLVYYKLMSWIKKDRGYYYKNCYTLHKIVMRDTRKRIFGISDLFRPGINLEDSIVEEKH